MIALLSWSRAWITKHYVQLRHLPAPIFVWKAERTAHSYRQRPLPITALPFQPASTTMLLENFSVESDRVVYTPESITSTYDYATTKLERGPDGNKWVIKPTAVEYQFKTDRRVPKLG